MRRSDTRADRKKLHPLQIHLPKRFQLHDPLKNVLEASIDACTYNMSVTALSAKMLCSSHMGTAANGANDCCDDWSLCCDLTLYRRRAHKRHVGMLQLQPVYFPATALGRWLALAFCIATNAARDAHSCAIQENM